MTNEYAKEDAMKRSGKELADEQARAILKKISSGELSAQALSEEELGKVVGALGDGGCPPGYDKEKWDNQGKEELKDMFQHFRRGLSGEGIQSRESTEKIRDVLKGKAKW